MDGKILLLVTDDNGYGRDIGVPGPLGQYVAPNRISEDGKTHLRFREFTSVMLDSSIVVYRRNGWQKMR